MRGLGRLPAGTGWAARVTAGLVVASSVVVLSGCDTAAPVQGNARQVTVVGSGKVQGVPDTLTAAGPRGVTAERLYVNQKTTDLVNKAEMEQSDYRESRFLNVFFGPEKRYFGIQASVLAFNAWVLVLSSLGMFVALYFILRHQLKSRLA